MSDLSKYDDWLTSDSIAAIVIREPLVPVEGADGVIFPATFAAAEDKKVFPGGYNIDVFPKDELRGLPPTLLPLLAFKVATLTVDFVQAGHIDLNATYADGTQSEDALTIRIVTEQRSVSDANTCAREINGCVERVTAVAEPEAAVVTARQLDHAFADRNNAAPRAVGKFQHSASVPDDIRSEGLISRAHIT